MEAGGVNAIDEREVTSPLLEAAETARLRKSMRSKSGKALLGSVFMFRLSSVLVRVREFMAGEKMKICLCTYGQLTIAAAVTILVVVG